MPFQSVLDGLVGAAPGVQAAMMLDGSGEVVLAAGARDERQQLIAAYHGVALGAVRRAGARVAAGGVALLTWRYDRGAVVVRPLKDGYYLVVCLGGGGLAPVLVHRTAEAQARMNEAL